MIPSISLGEVFAEWRGVARVMACRGAVFLVLV